MAVLGFLWIIAICIVNPVGEFPLSDDWVYASSVASLLKTGAFSLPHGSSPNLIAQSYWGVLVCRFLGFSFTSLRYSTLILGAVALIASYVMFRKADATRWISTIGAGLLFVNPLFFSQAFTFMTDVPYTAVSLTAICFILSWIEDSRPRSFAAGVLLALVSVLIRQFGVLLLVAIAVAYLHKRGASPGRLAAATCIGASGFVVHFLFQYWLKIGHRAPTTFIPQQGQMEHSLYHAQTLLKLVSHTMNEAVYLGLFLFPFVVCWAAWFFKCTVFPRSSKVKVAAATLCLILLFSLKLFVKERTMMPIEPGCLAPYGIGPLLMRDMAILHINSPTIPIFMKMFWLAATLSGIASGSALATLSLHILVRFVRSVMITVRDRSRPAAQHNLPEHRKQTAALFVGLYVVATSLVLPLIGNFDRYYIPIVTCTAFLILLAAAPAVHEMHAKAAKSLTVAYVAVWLVFSMAATRDYLEFNRVRWQATALLNEQGIKPNSIDGGNEYNHFYLSGQPGLSRAGKSWWRVDDDLYVIGSGPLPGYETVRELPYRRYLLMQNAAVFINRRSSISRNLSR